MTMPDLPVARGWRAGALALCLWAAGCSSQPPVPDWQRNARAAADIHHAGNFRRRRAAHHIVDVKKRVLRRDCPREQLPIVIEDDVVLHPVRCEGCDERLSVVLPDADGMVPELIGFAPLRGDFVLRHADERVFR